VDDREKWSGFQVALCILGGNLTVMLQFVLQIVGSNSEEQQKMFGRLMMNS